MAGVKKTRLPGPSPSRGNGEPEPRAKASTSCTFAPRPNTKGPTCPSRDQPTTPCTRSGPPLPLPALNSVLQVPSTSSLLTLHLAASPPPHPSGTESPKLLSSPDSFFIYGNIQRAQGLGPDILGPLFSPRKHQHRIPQRSSRPPGFWPGTQGTMRVSGPLPQVALPQGRAQHPPCM